MTDDRDICERLEDQSIDGAIFLRINAAKEIRALRHYVARLEDELAEEEYQHGRTIIKLENAQEHSSDQALDIVTLGQEVGRLKCERDEAIANTILAKASADYHKSQSYIETQNEIIRQRCEALIENARLREALEKIANVSLWEEFECPKIARAVLAEKEKK